jgi:hypothetical protein
MAQPYSELIDVKRWADRGLYEAVSRNFERLSSEQASIMLRILDHIHVVGDWYASYVRTLSENDLEQPVDFVFTSGKQARMRRREIILHVCMHGTYHRGNAGAVLQLKGLTPGRDAVSDFLEDMG